MSSMSNAALHSAIRVSDIWGISQLNNSSMEIWPEWSDIDESGMGRGVWVEGGGGGGQAFMRVGWGVWGGREEGRGGRGVLEGGGGSGMQNLCTENGPFAHHGHFGLEEGRVSEGGGAPALLLIAYGHPSPPCNP